MGPLLMLSRNFQYGLDGGGISGSSTCEIESPATSPSGSSGLGAVATASGVLRLAGVAGAGFGESG